MSEKNKNSKSLIKNDDIFCYVCGGADDLITYQPDCGHTDVLCHECAIDANLIESEDDEDWEPDLNNPHLKKCIQCQQAGIFHPHIKKNRLESLNQATNTNLTNRNQFMYQKAEKLLILASAFENKSKALFVAEAKKLDSKAKVRNRGTVCVSAEKAKDKKDHFPINNEKQARNALARVNQFSSVPDWYSGSLQSLVSLVARKVKSKYPSIEVSKDAKKPGKKKAYINSFNKLIFKTAQSNDTQLWNKNKSQWVKFPTEINDMLKITNGAVSRKQQNNVWTYSLKDNNQWVTIREDQVPYYINYNPNSITANEEQIIPNLEIKSQPVKKSYEYIPPEVQEALNNLGYKGEKDASLVKKDGKGDGLKGPNTIFSLKNYREKNKNRIDSNWSDRLMYEAIKRDAKGENTTEISGSQTSVNTPIVAPNVNTNLAVANSRFDKLIKKYAESENVYITIEDFYPELKAKLKEFYTRCNASKIKKDIYNTELNDYLSSINGFLTSEDTHYNLNTLMEIGNRALLSLKKDNKNNLVADDVQESIYILQFLIKELSKSTATKNNQSVKKSYEYIQPEVQEALHRAGFKGRNGASLVKKDGKGDGLKGPDTVFALNKYKEDFRKNYNVSLSDSDAIYYLLNPEKNTYTPTFIREYEPSGQPPSASESLPGLSSKPANFSRFDKLVKKYS